MNEMSITKTQAAQRQIDAGIRMLFRNEDPVAIHTVAMAGFRILRDLAKESGLEHPMGSMIRPGKEREFWGAFSSSSNFFKHADKDPNDILSTFREDANGWLLLIASTYYQLLGHQFTKAMLVLSIWYSAIHPDILSPNPNAEIGTSILAASGEIQSLSREEQLAGGQTMLKNAQF